MRKCQSLPMLVKHEDTTGSHNGQGLNGNLLAGSEDS